MKVNRSELLKALNKVKPGLASKEGIEQADSFVFENDCVFAYNDEITISHTVDVGGLQGVVRAKELLALLGKIKDKEIDLTEKDGELLIKGSSIKSGLTMYGEIQLPFVAPPEDAEWFDIPKNFYDGLKLCRFSTASESVSEILNAISISSDVMQSCDNYRITQFVLDAEMEDMLIPVAYCNQLCGYDFDICTIFDGWAHFAHSDNDDLAFACRILEEDYPELNYLMEVSGVEATLPEELSGILDTCGIFSSDPDATGLVDITISKTTCTVEGRSNHGWAIENFKIKTSDSVSFQANPNILKDILKLSHNAVMSESAMKFTANNFEHVLALTAK